MKTTLVACLLAVSMTSAFAADGGRKVDFHSVISDQDGRPFRECARPKADSQTDCAEFRDMTLGAVAVGALMVQEQNLSGEEQVRRALLAQEIYKSGEATLDARDTDTLCGAVARFVNKNGWSAMITLRAWEALDPARVKK